MPLNTAKIDDFSGGLNTEDPPHELDTNEFQSTTHDWEVSGPKGQSLKVRRPIRRSAVTSVALPAVGATTSITSLKTYRASAAFEDKLIGSNDEGGVWTIDITSAGSNVVVQKIAPTGGTSGRTWMFAQAQDSGNAQVVWMLNGVGTPQKMVISTGTVNNWGGTPPNGIMLIPWKNMMIISGVNGQTQRLYFSAINNPESWPATNFIDIKSTDDENDAITGLQVIGENLVVFKQRSVWLVFDSVTFENRRIGDIGCVNRFTCCRYLNQAYWLSLNGGFYSTDGENVKEESINVRFPMKNMAVFYANAAICRVAALSTGLIGVMGSAGTGSGGEFYYMDLNRTRKDKQHPWFMFTTGQMGGLTGFVEANTNVLTSGAKWVGIAGSSTQNLYHLFSAGSRDDSDSSTNVDIGAVYRSPMLAVQGTENKERLRRINLMCRGGGVGSLTVKVYADGVNKLNTAVLAGTSWGVKRVRPESRGRFHEIQLEGNYASDEVSEVEMKYRGGKEH